MSIANSGQMRRLIERIQDEDTRRAIDGVLKESLNEDDVRKVVTTTTFGFEESSDDSGNKQVRLRQVRRVGDPQEPPPDNRMRQRRIRE